MIWKWLRSHRTMFAIAVLAAFVVAFTVLKPALNSDIVYHAEAEKIASEKANDADNESARRCRILSGIERSRCENRVNDRARDHQRQEFNLEAQRRAAAWTRVAGLATTVAMVVGIVGVLLVFGTFSVQQAQIDLARRQYIDARKDSLRAERDASEAHEAARTSNRTAARQLKIAQESAYRELRAYLSFEKIEIVRVLPASVKARVTLKNAGKTPAAFELFLNTWVGPHPSNERPKGAPEPVRWNFHGPFINASSIDPIDLYYPIPLNNEAAAPTIAAMLANPLPSALYVYGRVEFVDFQRRRRALHFAYRNHGPLVMNQGCEMIPCPWGNHYEDRGIEKA